MLLTGSLRKQRSVRRSFYNTRSRSSFFLKIVTLVSLGYFLMRHRDFSKFASFATQTYLTLACYTFGESARIRVLSISQMHAPTSCFACKGLQGSGLGFMMQSSVASSILTKSTLCISTEWRRLSGTS